MTLLAIIAVIVLGAMLIALTPRYLKWQERRRMDKRNAKLRARGIIPFPRSNR